MKSYNVPNYVINLNKPALPQEQFRFAFLTDLHNQADEEEKVEIFRILAENAVDIVLCGGDMIVAHKGISIEPGLHFMQELATRYTVYAGTGNHEYRARIYREQYGAMYREYRDGLEKAGVHVLENEHADIEAGSLPVRVYGFDMRAQYYDRFKHIQLPPVELREAIGVPDTEEYINILMAHNPAGKSAYLSWGADVTLCGHYHGGVMRLGGNRGLISPDFRLFPNNAYGQMEQDGRYMIVSSGCGEHTIPVRLNNPREVVIVDIRNRM